MCLVFSSDFNQILSSSADFRKYPTNIKFRENWSKGRHADTRGQTDKDGRTDMTNLLNAIPYLYKSTYTYE
jgi:hypothetical protein